MRLFNCRVKPPKRFPKMSFFGKEYTFVRQENFDGFLKAIGLSDEKSQLVINFKSSHTISKDGDTYINKSKQVEGVREVKFKSGVELEDTIGPEKIPIKSTYVVDGNTVTQTVKGPTGEAVFKREYNGDELVMTITTNKWDGVAKRYYKA